MNIVQVEEKTISGLSVRTKNSDEMNPKTSKIGALYQWFDDSVVVDYKNGSRAYGMYFGYDSGSSGEFTVLAGTDNVESSTEKLESVSIPKGNYMVFDGKGEVPQMVIDTWASIWEYFENEVSEYKRAYTTDFEYYRGPGQVEIYIAIQ